MTRMKTDLHRLLIFKIDIVGLWFLLPLIYADVRRWELWKFDERFVVFLSRWFTQMGADGNVEIDDPICEALTLIFWDLHGLLVFETNWSDFFILPQITGIGTD